MEENIKIFEVGIVGGTKGGKSSVMSAAREEFHGDEIVFVPEVSSLLNHGGFPMPDSRFPLGDPWQYNFQDAVFYTQLAIEEECRRRARMIGAKVMVKDRTLGCGAAYFPGKLAEFCQRYSISPEALRNRERMLYHLESLATASPEDYRLRGFGRMEGLERAQMLEMVTREVHQGHPHRIMMLGMGGVAAKADRLIGILRYLLTSP